MINFPIFAGIAASFLHVISGPDHLAAVTPLAIETRRKVWRIGLLWGLGHLCGMLIIGMLFLLFRQYLPLEQISAYSDKLVGIVLIAIGLWALLSVFYKNKNHKHPHLHGGDKPYIHIHTHEHGDNTLNHSHTHPKSTRQSLWTSYGIGVLHGLAGIAHFILFLPVIGFENLVDSILYIFGFGLGTVMAMTIYTFLLGQTSKYAKNRKSLFKTIRLSGGVFALVVGIYWIFLNF